MYVKRDADGRVVSVSVHGSGGASEYVAPGDPELAAFIGADSSSADEQMLMRQSDLDLVRVLEDVIGLLIDKDVIRFTDLPKQAQRKLSERHFMRGHINSVGLIDESGEEDSGLV